MGIARAREVLRLFRAARRASRAVSRRHHQRRFCFFDANPQRSAAAAKEIGSLIAESNSRVESGAGLVDRAGSTMREIEAAIQRVARIVGEIAAASKEQSEGIKQVSLAVTQMDEVTQQNAALVEESAATANSLANQARQLSELTGAFKVALD
jgi:methyl-accepting chemotaxis protein-1 (serine sensor receptor)